METATPSGPVPGCADTLFPHGPAGVGAAMVDTMWEELYKQHYQELLRKAMHICRNSAQAEDAVQDTFLRALQNVSVVEDLGPSQRRAWLFRALKNLLTDSFRRNTLEDQYTMDLPPEAAVEQSSVINWSLSSKAISYLF